MIEIIKQLLQKHSITDVHHQIMMVYPELWQEYLNSWIMTYGFISVLLLIPMYILYRVIKNAFTNGDYEACCVLALFLTAFVTIFTINVYDAVLYSTSSRYVLMETIVQSNRELLNNKYQTELGYINASDK